MDFILIKAINDDGSRSFREIEIKDTPSKQSKIDQVPLFVQLLEEEGIEVFKVTDYQIITSDGIYIVATPEELNRVEQMQREEEVSNESS